MSNETFPKSEEREEAAMRWGEVKVDLKLWSFDVGGFSIIKYGNNWTMTKESATVKELFL